MSSYIIPISMITLIIVLTDFLMQYFKVEVFILEMALIAIFFTVCITSYFYIKEDC